MIKIRNSRLKKSYQKNGKLVYISKVVCIIYLMVITFVYLGSYTGAYFNDSDQATVSFQSSAIIWDKSSLTFPNESKDQVVYSCNPESISVVIKNMGNNMTGATEYEVYFIESGNPKQGVKVAEGVIQPINSNQTANLTYLASKPGEFKFRAFQRTGHNHDYENRKDLWSETIKVVCNQVPQVSTTPEIQEQPANTNQQNQTGKVLNETTNNTNPVEIEQPKTETEKSTINEAPTETTEKTVKSNQGDVNN